MTQTWLQNYFKQAIKPRTRNVILVVLADSKFILTNQEYHDLIQKEEISKSIFKHFKKLTLPLEKNLTQNNKEFLVKNTIENILKEIELKIFNLRFNQLGGYYFDLFIRNLISIFMEYQQRALFSRLIQISIIVNVESIEDYSELCRDKTFKWLLTKNEVKRLLSSKVELDSNEISKLNFE